MFSLHIYFFLLNQCFPILKHKFLLFLTLYLNLIRFRVILKYSLLNNTFLILFFLLMIIFLFLSFLILGYSFFYILICNHFLLHNILKLLLIHKLCLLLFLMLTFWLILVYIDYNLLFFLHFALQILYLNIFLL